jgi:RHS repeat-associated protein
MKETNPDPNNYEGEDNPLWEFYFYTITGQKLLTIDCDDANAKDQPSCWPVGENIYFGKRLLVSNGVYVATDRLGTVRANTQGESYQYYPFGEERSNQPDGRDKFATYFRDGVGQDYAEQRYYNAGAGSFWTVDPGGIKAADPSNPITWNRYGYAYGDPVNMFDPAGTHAVMTPVGSDCYEDPEYGLVCDTVDGVTDMGSGTSGPSQSGGGPKCAGIAAKIWAVLSTGAGMPGGKSLLVRVVQQITGTAAGFDSHQEQIDNYRNRLRNLRKEWEKNDCDPPDNDPPYGLNNWINETAPGVLKQYQKEYQQYLTDVGDVAAGTATAAIYAAISQIVTSIGDFLASLGGSWELIVAM